jgi:hypothetical protein
MSSSVFSTPQTPLERAQYYIHVSSRYTNPGLDRIKRHFEYCISPGSITSTRAAGTAVISSALLFGKIGQELGKSSDKELGPLIGGGTGLVLGACAGGFTYVKVIEASDAYKEWIRLKLDHAIKASTTYSYSNDIILRGYCCPLTLCIMDTPSFTPSGTLYDMEYLLNCPRDSQQKIKDPLNNPSFRANEIKEHWEMAFFIKKRLQFLIKKDLEVLNDSQELKKSLENQLIHIDRTANLYYEYARKGIEDRRKNKTISATEYKKEMEEFEKLFGIDENQELDWSLDWQSTLLTRFKKFNPDAKVVN